jgi:hypothetical protein
MELLAKPMLIIIAGVGGVSTKSEGEGSVEIVGGKSQKSSRTPYFH